MSPTTGEICVSALQKDWQPDCGLAHIMLALRSLFMSPNPDSALNEAAGRLLTEDYAAFCARASLLAHIHARAPLQCAAVDKDGCGESDAKTIDMHACASVPPAEGPSVKENAPQAAKRARRL